MRVHRKHKELPVYALLVVKNGSQLKPAENASQYRGNRNFRINFEPESSGEGFHPICAAIFTPFQDLDLRLEPQKDQVEMLAIDSVEHPSDN